MEQELIKRKINYQPQFTLRGADGRFVACIDFFLPEHNCAVEVNGTYWHADPRFYGQLKLSKSQLRTQTFYDRKLKLLSELGITLIELWEHDIKQGMINLPL